MSDITVGQALYTKSGDRLTVTSVRGTEFEVEYNGYTYLREITALEVSIFTYDPIQAAKKFTGVKDETFLLEEGHLKETQEKLESFGGFLQGMHFATNGVAIGASYGFDEYSKEKIINSPYFARMDLQDDYEKDTMRVYVGKKGVYCQGEMLICDWRSKAGQFYYLKNQNKYSYNNYMHSLLLRRQLEISDGNLVSYEDEYISSDFQEAGHERPSAQEKASKNQFSPQFSSAPQSDRIADPFLQKVLQQKHQQNELTDIIVSIQENQNEIIQADLTRNMVIQGCAGSGKTMILLHRLSFLKYRNKALDVSKIKIITPNSLFNLHIDELASSLEIEKIEKLTVEEYYAELLSRYHQSERSAFPLKYSARDSAAFKTSSMHGHTSDDERLYDDDIVAKAVQFAGIAAKETLAVDLGFTKANEILQRSGYRELPTEGESAPRLVGAAITYLTNIVDALEDYSKQKSQFAASKAKFEEAARQLNDKKSSLEDADKLLSEVASRITSGNKRLRETYSEHLHFLQSQYDICQKELQRPALTPERRRFLQEKTASIKQQIEEYEFCITAADYIQTKRMQDIDDKKYQKASEAAVFSGGDIDVLTNTLKLARAFKMTDFIRKVMKRVCGTTPKELSVRNRQFLSLWVYFAVMGPLRDGERMLCIDEGQDISVNEYKLLYKINGSNVCVNIYGDTEQLIKPHGGIADWAQLQSVFSFSRYNLYENYRNTSEIIDYCNRELCHTMTNIGIPGEPVSTIQQKSFLSHLNQLLIGSQRAAILCSEKELGDIQSMQSKIHHKLHRHGIVPGDIALLTPKEAKGLEFDVCYVLPSQLTKNERYISFTRALSELYIVLDDAGIGF